MSDLSLFYSSMSNVLNQWSDFRVSKGLYKEYFAMQKAQTKSAAEEAAKSVSEKKTATKAKNYTSDKLKTYSDNLSSSIKKLETAFKEDEKTGGINRDDAYKAASEFVDSYNELVSSIKKSGNAAVSNRSEYIANMTTAYANKFAEVGIKANSDGTITLDKDKFMTASADDYDKVFGKKNSFASYMQTQANGLSAYAGTSEYLNPDPYTKVDTASATASGSNVSGYLYDKYF